MVRDESSQRETEASETSRSRERENDQPISSLLRDLRDEASDWIRQETRLAKAEISEKITLVSKNLGLLIAGALTAYTGVIILLIAAGIGGAMLLEMVGMGIRSAFLTSFGLVGLAATGIGVSLVIKAKNSFSAEELSPERTVKTLQETKEWAGEKLQ